jgi:hypothetical protein
MSNCLAVSKRLAFVIAAGLALSGCCLGSGCYIQPPTNALTGWDRLGRLAKRQKVNRVKVRKPSEALASDESSPTEDELAKLRPYSKEWGATLDAINRAADVKLRKKLIICRGCMLPEPGDQTGSIAPR